MNLIVDHSAARGAPVVTLAQATLSQLAGKVEHVPVLMAMVTDFMFIRPGALHQANGGVPASSTRWTCSAMTRRGTC